MKFLKFSFITILFSTMIILTSCTTDEKEGKLFKETYENMQTQYNFEMDMTIELEINNENLSSVSKMSMDMESDTVGEAKLEMNIGGMDIDGYIDFDGQNAITYVYVLGIWGKVTQPISDYYNEDGTADDYIEALNDYVSVKELTDSTLTDGTKVKVFEFKVDMPNLLDETLGEEFDISELGLTKAELEEILEDVVYKISIDEEEKVIRKIEMDLKPIMDEILDIAKEKDSSIDESFDKFKVIIEFEKFGEVNIDIPESIKTTAIGE